LELDDALCERSNKAIAEALAGGHYLTRAELGAVLARADIVAEGMRLGYIVHRAELDAIVCSGPRRGKQFTYALLDERAPQAKTLARDEALAELTRRYFTSHGPAMIQDFAWWTGLTVADVKKGLEMAKDSLIRETVGEQTFWLAPDMPLVKASSPTVYLLPNYDEYLISFRDSRYAVDPQYLPLFDLGNAIFSHFVVLDGRVIGSWKRTFEKKTVVIALRLFEPVNEVQFQAIRAAVERFGRFLGMPVTLVDDPLPADFD
jgi:hypothetical protein